MSRMNDDPFDNEFSRFRIPDFPQFRPPPSWLKNAWIGLLVLLAAILVWGSFYQIQPEEVGVVLRLGRHVRTTSPWPG